MRTHILLALLLAAPAWSQDKPQPDTVEQAAGKVLAALKAGDGKALSALVQTVKPDAWLVADHLCARGEHDAAATFAQAAPAPDREKLPAFVAACRELKFDRAGREKLVAGTDLLNRKAFTEALTAMEGVTHDTGVIRIRILQIRGRILVGLRKYDDALAAFRAAGKAAEELGWLAHASVSWERAAFACWRKADYRGAIDGLEQRVAVEDKRGNPKDMGDTLTKIGLVCNRLGDYPSALKALQRALAALDKANDRLGMTKALLNLGRTYNSIGRYDDGLACCTRAAALAREVKDETLLAQALGMMASAYESKGQPAKALTLLDEAVAIKERLGDKRSLAVSFQARANYFNKLGQLEQSLKSAERARELFKEAGDRHGVGSALLSIGNIRFLRGEYKEAIEVWEPGVQIMTEVGDMDFAGVFLGNMASAYAQLGEHDKSLEMHEQALQIKQKVGAASSVAHTLLGIGGAHRLAGNYNRAIEYLERALRMAEELGERMLVVSAHAEFTDTYVLSGSPRLAIQSAHRAIAELNAIVRGLSEEVGATAREKYLAVYELGARAAMAVKDADEFAYFMESGRAGALLEAMGGRAQVKKARLSPALRAAEHEARTAVIKAEAALVAAQKAKKLKDARAKRKERDAALDKLQTVIQRIQREANAAATLLDPEPLSLKRIQGLLGAGDALVLYGLFTKVALAMVVTPDDARLIHLGEPNAIADACNALVLDDAETDPQKQIDVVRRLAFAPLRIGDETKRLLVSPSGALAYVPFALLAGDREIAYVPSGTTYALLREAETARGSRILALGDPVYTGDLEPLPHTRAEAEHIGDTVLTGKDANRKALAQALAKQPRWRAVHLACHGLVDPERPTLSSLALTDGKLSAFDVLGMTIAADLVVLSACETGRGQIVRGEGILGFTRTFMLAGTPRVVVSLWPVEDKATQALMTEFYRLWKGGEVTAASALAQAQAHVRKEARWSHPLYWAAWQLWGLPD